MEWAVVVWCLVLTSARLPVGCSLTTHLCSLQVLVVDRLIQKGKDEIRNESWLLGQGEDNLKHDNSSKWNGVSSRKLK